VLHLVFSLVDMQVSFMQCVAVCCSVLQCVAVGVLSGRDAGVLHVVCCNMLRYVAVCCSVLQSGYSLGEMQFSSL